MTTARKKQRWLWLRKELMKELALSDVYMTAAVSMQLQEHPRYRVEKGKTLFIYEVTDRLYKAMSDYNSGNVLVDALEYANTIKRLRAEMLMRRSSESSPGFSALGVYHAG